MASPGMSRTAVLACVASVALASVAGCASPARPVPAEPAAAVEPARASVADQQVALDFVNAIVQLVDADAPPLRFLPDEGEGAVLGTIRTMLGQAGYGVEPATEERGERVVRHRADVIESEGRRVRRHDVTVGDVELRRSYRSTDAGTLLPASALYVRGADAASVRMVDEELFGVDGAGDGLPPALPDELLIDYRYLLTEVR